MLNIEDYKSQAEFNGGLAQIFRMDAWAKLSARGLLFNDPKQRYNALILYFNECYGTDNNTKRKKKMYDFYMLIEKRMIEYFNTKKNSNIQYKNHPDYYLQRWEMILREWAQMLGLGMKKASDGQFAIME